MRSFLRVAAALSALSFAVPAVAADSYPSRTVKLIVPFGAGGPADVYARFLAKYLSDETKQSFVVEDRPGAGSVIGTGVFGLPAALAPFGPVSLVAFVLVTIGALALALVFGALSKRIGGSGGPYVYARDAFGEFAGFLNAWCYWITAWAGKFKLTGSSPLGASASRLAMA